MVICTNQHHGRLFLVTLWFSEVAFILLKRKNVETIYPSVVSTVARRSLNSICVDHLEDMPPLIQLAVNPQAMMKRSPVDGRL